MPELVQQEPGSPNPVGTERSSSPIFPEGSSSSERIPSGTPQGVGEHRFGSPSEKPELLQHRCPRRKKLMSIFCRTGCPLEHLVSELTWCVCFDRQDELEIGQPRRENRLAKAIIETGVCKKFCRPPIGGRRVLQHPAEPGCRN